ncbi:MAG: hypothetical protein WCI97_03125 [Bacteroidota bacterium]
MLRLFNIGLLLTFSICYLEWPGHADYMLQLQIAVFTSNDLIAAFTHPAIITPLIGELLILISLIRPNKKLTLLGMILLGLIVLLFLAIGIMGVNFKIILFTLPYLLLSISFLFLRKRL